MDDHEKGGRGDRYHPPGLGAVLVPRYLAERDTPRRPEDLASHACLQHRYATSGKLERWPLRGQQNFTLPTAVVVSTIEPLITMAEDGLGIACLPDFAIRRQLKDGTLVLVLAKHMQHSGLFRLLWPQSRYPSPKLKAFSDFMAERLFIP